MRATQAQLCLTNRSDLSAPTDVHLALMHVHVGVRFFSFPGDTIQVVDVDCGQAAAFGAPAYTIFTSGSSGKPKAITIKHSGLRICKAWRIAHRMRSFDVLTIAFSLPRAQVYPCAGSIDAFVHHWLETGHGLVEAACPQSYTIFVKEEREYLQSLEETPKNTAIQNSCCQLHLSIGQAIVQ